jgi:CheY-like chemotaxis protein
MGSNCGGNRVVLIVEDDKDVQSSLAEFFADQGFEPLSVGNGREALDLLGRTATLPCIIVLDYTMPIMNGGEFLQVKQADIRLRSIPVVLVSASSEALRQHGGGATRVMAKPVDTRALLAVANEHCA